MYIIIHYVRKHLFCVQNIILNNRILGTSMQRRKWMKDRRQGDSNSTTFWTSTPNWCVASTPWIQDLSLGWNQARMKLGSDVILATKEVTLFKSTLKYMRESCLYVLQGLQYLYLMSKKLNMWNPFIKETPTSPNIFQAIPLWNAFMTIWLSPLFYTLYYIPVVMGLAHLFFTKNVSFHRIFFRKKMAVHLLILAEGFGVDDVEGDDEVTLLTPWTSRADTISIIIYSWLVVFRQPSEKWWSASVGMMTFPIYGKIFQSTNQIVSRLHPNIRASWFMFCLIYDSMSSKLFFLTPFSSWFNRRDHPNQLHPMATLEHPGTIPNEEMWGFPPSQRQIWMAFPHPSPLWCSWDRPWTAPVLNMAFLYTVDVGVRFFLLT